MNQSNVTLISLIVLIIFDIYVMWNNELINYQDTKPNLSIYFDAITSNCLMSFLVIQNFGKTGTYIENLEYDPELNKYLNTIAKLEIKALKGTYIAPNQKIKVNLIEPICIESDMLFNFKIQYNSYYGFIKNKITRNFKLNFCITQRLGNSITFDTNKSALESIANGIIEICKRL